MPNENERYIVVTCISSFRQRYAIPLSELQALNPDINIMNDPEQQISWANDSVTMEEVKEFSQKWLGESIVDTFILDEERVKLMFNRDNDYLSSWSDEKKIEWIKDWRVKK
tara:strand:+ start:152 stop:484 length:333 start_codon:yes stop_codon:yes gene_type:complete